MADHDPHYCKRSQRGDDWPCTCGALDEQIAELERLLLTALAIHGGEAHTYSEKEWRTEARVALGLQKPDQE